jgi:SWI/SNF-related matrix-associated actin-dependent regulator 1 of chromatin subfamily A
LERNKQNYAVKASSFNFPVPAGVVPRSYQKSGVEEILRRIEQGFKGCILGDEPGVGKSSQAIFLANYLNFKSILVVCPNSIKLNWRKEFNKFSTKSENPVVIAPNSTKLNIIQAKICIINYDILHKFKKVLVNKAFDYCIVDEGHNFSNEKTKRTQALVSVLETTSFNLFLTGTPISNRVKDLRNVLNLVDPDPMWNNWFKYAKQFCALKKGKYGWDDSGSSNLRMLSNILKHCYLIRRKKSDILQDLPEKNIVYIPVEGSKVFRKLNEKLIGKYGTFERTSELNRKILKDKTFQEARKEAGRVKLKPLYEMIDNYLSSGEPLVVFAYHVEFQQEIINRHKKCSYITGGMKAEDRQLQVDRFQNGESEIIVLSLDAGREGITLTRAAFNIFLEPDYNPSKMKQAHDRIHRVGQERNCTIIHLYIPESIDEYILTMAEDKDKYMGRVID